ncbi:MAG: hypothetical protein GEU99_11025 [Luteitalea sp.]|nr:hypothetical protein [Luteitalea sp.]
MSTLLSLVIEWAQDRGVRRCAALLLITSLVALSVGSARAETTPIPPPPLFQLFLKGGESIHCYGEWTRTGHRVVFTVPLDLVLPGETPRLQTVTLPESRIDWRRTERYARSVRAARYAATRGEGDYAELAADIAETLGRIRETPSPEERVRIAETARRRLAAWPARHHGYRATDVRQFVAMLDETIARLRQATGDHSFDLALIADTVPPREPLRPAPTLPQVIEQALDLAGHVEIPTERLALLEATYRLVDERARALPERWTRDVAKRLEAALAAERSADQAYARLTKSSLQRAQRLAAKGDVSGVEALGPRIQQRDAALGRKRPGEVSALIAAVDRELQAARRQRLLRDQWELREPLYRAYQRAVSPVLECFERHGAALEAIRTLAGPEAKRLGKLESQLVEAFVALARVKPTPDLQAPHALVTNAVHLALTATRSRRAAAASANMQVAWDAAAAASGALMLVERARDDIARVTRKPSFP